MASTADVAAFPPSFRSPSHRSRLRRSTFAAAILLATLSAGAAELRGRVVAVADGDTLTVADHARKQHKIRLAGIDAPEMRQPYGLHARQNLAALVLGRPVVVSWHKLDRHGRMVGHVRLASAGECATRVCARLQDVGLAQIESGLAWHYKRYLAEQTLEERDRYSRAEREARIRREGLWKEPQPVPPWEYRAQPQRVSSYFRQGFPARFAISFRTWSVISMPGRA